ncbi:MAG: gatA 7 [Glaciihabitans sp.]|nr:gatA 7 [Glaciihabitans sp.]
MSDSHTSDSARETPTQRVRRALARISEVDRPEIWITLRAEADLLGDAASVEARIAAGEQLPLAGRLVAVKDNIDVAGLPTTAAHPAFRFDPETDSPAVARLRAAGAVVLGKTNLDQFATGLVGSRSPYGAVRSAHFPDRVSGGSSSGSAVAVALGIVDISLGTDTAGSGRVPAALNGIVGIKATRGLVPLDGVVPASRSYDCVTVFAAHLGPAVAAMKVAIGPSATDPQSRVWPADTPRSARAAPRVAVPRPEDLVSLDPERVDLFRKATERLRLAGAEIVELDLTPFLAAARLLYDGALVTERSAAYGEFLATHPEGADPTVARIAAAAAGRSGVAVVADQERLARFRVQAMASMDGIDALLVPTAPTHPTLAAVAAEPITENSKLGTFTNFMNLFDLCGVAVPAGQTSTGLFGVTVVARAFADQVAVDLAAELVDEAPAVITPDGAVLAVFGAHLSGQPLNHQLESVGARYLETTRTSAEYSMLALPGVMPKPGIVRSAPGAGTELECELWSLSPSGLGVFLAGLPAPMALGRTTLADGREVIGFACTDPAGPDVSSFGGWRAYLASR